MARSDPIQIIWKWGSISNWQSNILYTPILIKSIISLQMNISMKENLQDRLSEVKKYVSVNKMAKRALDGLPYKQMILLGYINSHFLGGNQISFG